MTLTNEPVSTGEEKTATVLPFHKVPPPPDTTAEQEKRKEDILNGSFQRKAKANTERDRAANNARVISSLGLRNKGKPK